MARGTGLLWRALQRSKRVQADFARLDMQVSPRTLTRMLKGERTLTADELTKVRTIIAFYSQEDGDL